MTEFIVRMNDFQVIYTIYTKGLKFHMTERLVFYFLLTWLYTSFISFHLFITFLAEPRFRSSNLGLFLIFGLVTWRWIPWSMVSWYGPSLFPPLGPVLSPVLYSRVWWFYNFLKFNCFPKFNLNEWLLEKPGTTLKCLKTSFMLCTHPSLGVNSKNRPQKGRILLI